MKSNKIYRSIPQILNSHLPGSIKSYGNNYYKLNQIFLEVEESNILDIVYNDLIYKLTKWGNEAIEVQQTFKENLKEVKLSDIFSINTDNDKKFNLIDFNQEALKNTDGFKKTYKIGSGSESFFSINQVSSGDDSFKHKAEYFPYSFRCSACNRLVYSKKYPHNKCNCPNHSKWIQLSIVLVSPDGKVSCIKDPNGYNPSSNERHDYNEVKCGHPQCTGYLHLKEATQAKNYKLICSKNHKHENPLFSKNKMMPYSIFSSSLFIVHTSEVINFTQGNNLTQLIDNNVEISDNDFLKICEKNIQKMEDIHIDCLNDFKNNDRAEKNKKLIISAYKTLFTKTSSNSINLDLDNPSVNKFCHSQIYQKLVKQRDFDYSENNLISFTEISLVNDIEVINYAYGFTRISDKPRMTPCGQVKFNFFYENKRSDILSAIHSNFPDKIKKKQLFYSKENNKGLYFKIDPNNINKLLNNSNLFLPSEEKFLKQDRIHSTKEFNLIFTYLHSLAHYFIKTISQHFSGISTSSLSEMIYPNEFSFVIYKTGTGKDLGYLESFFDEYILGQNEEFFNYINDPTNLICPAFELCSNGACIECLYTSKHTCKYENDMLNRDLIIKNE